MRIGLLELDHVSTRFRAIDGDYSDMFREMVATADPSSELVGYDAINGVLPDRPDECDGWLITGSRASVYDDEPWIAPITELVREVHGARVPCVGVCFGHQLLAHALGGRTERAAVGWGVGALPMTIARAEPWMDPHRSTATLLYSHQDQVVELPADGRVLAAAAHCPVAMLAIGDDVIGLQAHPEFGAAYVRALLEDRVDRIGEAEQQAALATLREPTDEHTVAAWILGFLRSRVPQA
jgi:GMP synthase-like glutamine amidotransferase